MNHETRRAEERLAEAAPDLLYVAQRFVDLYGAGGPESAFDALYDDAIRIINQALPDDNDSA